MNNSVKLYDQHGAQIVKTREINPDPSFLWSSRSWFGNSKSIEQPYSTHAWVYACVKAIASPSAELPRYIAEIDKNGEEVDKNYTHEIIRLFQHPNPAMSGNEIWEAILLALLLPTARTPGGQVFLYFDTGSDKNRYDYRNPKTIPMHVWPYTDNVIESRLDSRRHHVGWNLVYNGTVMREFEPGELIRIRQYNPYNPLQGLSPYSAAMSAVEQDVTADKINTKYMDNSGMLGGVLSTDSEMITQQELRAYREAFEENYSGADNAGRVAALAYGLKYEHFMATNRDMQYIEMRADNRQRIQAAYGVNAEEIGVYESGLNRATAEQASRDVWQKTRLPLITKINMSLNSLWVENMERGQLRVCTDVSGVDSLRDVWGEEVEVAGKMVTQMRIPPAEAARITGIPVDSEAYQHLKKSLVSLYLVDADVAAEGGVPFFPATIPPDEVTGISSPKKQLQSVVSVLPEVNQREADLLMREREVERANRWHAHVRETLDPGEAEVSRVFNQHWRRQLEAVSRNVSAWVVGKSLTLRELLIPSVDAVLWDQEEYFDELVAKYGKATANQMKRAATALKKESNGAIEWNVKQENVQTFVANRRGVLEKIDNKTSKDVYKVYNDVASVALDEGWTQQEFARAIDESMKGLVDQYSLGRAVTTARTEAGSITMDARMEAFADAGIERHEWVTARDIRVRDEHRIDGQVRKINEPFTNNMKYPLEPGADIDMIANCRCMTTPVFED